jgi:hypothetical protein
MDAIDQLRKEREALVKRLKNVDGAITLLTDHPATGNRAPAKKQVSAAARLKMSQAAKARWAEKKKGKTKP